MIGIIHNVVFVEKKIILILQKNVFIRELIINEFNTFFSHFCYNSYYNTLKTILVIIIVQLCHNILEQKWFS